MDRGAWRAIAHEIAGVGHDLATKPPPQLKELKKRKLDPEWAGGRKED